MHRAVSVQKMKSTLQMLTVAKDHVKQKIHIAFVAIALEQDFPRLVEANVSTEHLVGTPKLGTISEEEAESNNMIGAVDI